MLVAISTNFIGSYNPTTIPSPPRWPQGGGFRYNYRKLHCGTLWVGCLGNVIQDGDTFCKFRKSVDIS